MRHCRICNRTYDDSETFCGIDGTILRWVRAPGLQLMSIRSRPLLLRQLHATLQSRKKRPASLQFKVHLELPIQ